MPIIGIDTGASNSAAAVLLGGRLVIVPSAEGITVGGKACPSYVALTADGQMLIGEPTRRQATVNPEGTATAFERLIGGRGKCGYGPRIRARRIVRLPLANDRVGYREAALGNDKARR